MRMLGSWDNTTHYARFLCVQYTARLPLEAWLSKYAPSDLQPPSQCELIRCDLRALDQSFVLPPIALELSSKACPIGVSWALAGSALGNLSLSKELKLRNNSALPDDFLKDRAMLDFWQTLKPRLESNAESGAMDAATKSAGQVFSHFQKVADLALTVG